MNLALALKVASWQTNKITSELNYLHFSQLTADLDETKAKYVASKETVDGFEEKLQPIQVSRVCFLQCQLLVLHVQISMGSIVLNLYNWFYSGIDII